MRRNTLVRLLACAALNVIAAAMAMVSTTPAHASANCSEVSIKAANGLYVSAEIGYTGSYYGMLRARASTVGPWEKFQKCWLDVNHFALYSEANGLYVRADLGYATTDPLYGMLRASINSIGGPYETFFDDSGDAIVAYNNRWVSAELSYPGSERGMLRARATSIGPWEIFNWT